MQTNIPTPIMGENDLDSYQDYLNSDSFNGTGLNGNNLNGNITGGNMSNIGNMPSQNAVNQNTVGKNPFDANNDNMSMIPSNNAFVPETLSNTAFLPAYLTQHVGKLMKIEFLLANTLESRIGWLMTVGSNYLVLKLYNSNTTMTCDIFSIRFVTIVHDNDLRRLMLK